MIHNINLFLNNHILHPLFKEISATKQVICRIAREALSCFTCGLMSQPKKRRRRFVCNPIIPTDPRFNTIRLWISHAQHDEPAEAIEQINRLIKKLGDEVTRLKDRNHSNLLHCLAKQRKPIALVKEFAQLGVDFNQQDEKGNTPLLWAIANGNNSMAMEILKYEQNLDLMGYGNTALHLAIAKGYTDKTKDGAKLSVTNAQIVSILLEKGADPSLFNHSRKKGMTPLHLAVVRRDQEMVKALLDGGARVDEKTLDGKTCENLLNLTYEEADAILKKVAVAYLLDKEKFENQKADIQKLITRA